MKLIVNSLLLGLASLEFKNVVLFVKEAVGALFVVILTVILPLQTLLYWSTNVTEPVITNPAVNADSLMLAFILSAPAADDVIN